MYSLLYQLESSEPGQKPKSQQKIINLTELTPNVNIEWLASMVMDKCSLIPEGNRKDLEQILQYLQRSANSRAHSASSISERSTNSPSINVSMDELDSYMELLYEDMAEKTQGSAAILELAKNPSNLIQLAENEILISALSRVLRDEWRKNLELAKNIISVFLLLSSYHQTQHIVIQQKMGAFCINVLELELERGMDWLNQLMRGDEQNKKKCEIGLRREHAMLGVTISLLLNLAEDITVEMKMLRKGLLPLLVKCLHLATTPSQSSTLLPPVLAFLLKLSVMVENHQIMEKEEIGPKISSLFPIAHAPSRRSALSLLFNLSFYPSIRSSLLPTGLIQHTAQLCNHEEKALALLYQLTLSSDSRSLLPFTDAITQLVSDVINGKASDITKAILLNASLDKRTTQIMAGGKGDRLESLIRLAVEEGDLLVAKIVRNMAAHPDTIHTFLVKWIPTLLRIVMEEGMSEEEAISARALELLGIVCECRGVEWDKLNREMGISEWLASTLIRSRTPDHEPFQLQQVILASRLAGTVEGARSVVGLMDHFLSLLNTLQEDDELVTQLLFFFLTLLNHPEIAERLLEGEEPALPPYIADLIHDNNAKVMGEAEKAARIIANLSPEWNKRLMTEKFRYHNAQWLEMVEKEGGEEEEEDLPFDEAYLYNDDHYLDYDYDPDM